MINVNQLRGSTFGISINGGIVNVDEKLIDILNMDTVADIVASNLMQFNLARVILVSSFTAIVISILCTCNGCAWQLLSAFQEFCSHSYLDLPALHNGNGAIDEY